MDNKIIKAAIEAGQEILKVYESEAFEVEMKGDNSPLTLADKKSHEKIMETLSKSEHPTLSEESDDALKDYRHDWTSFWLVDPLDGTKEFINKNGEFTVNIAFIQNHKAVEGVIYVPVKKDLYFTKDGKSYKQSNVSNFSDFDESKATALQKRKTDDTIMVVASKSHMSPETQQKIDEIQEMYPTKKVETISVGSSLKLCMVAEGKADFYPRYAPTMEWDIAAGHAICKGAEVPVVQAKSKEEVVYNKADLLNPWFEVGDINAL